MTDSRGMVWEWCGECLTARERRELHASLHAAWQMSSRLRRASACAVRGKQDTVAAACGEAARQCAAGLWCRLEVQPFATRVYLIEINFSRSFYDLRRARPGGPRRGARAEVGMRVCTRRAPVESLSLQSRFSFCLFWLYKSLKYILPAAASDVQRVSRGPCPVPARSCRRPSAGPAAPAPVGDRPASACPPRDTLYAWHPRPRVQTQQVQRVCTLRIPITKSPVPS